MFLLHIYFLSFDVTMLAPKLFADKRRTGLDRYIVRYKIGESTFGFDDILKFSTHKDAFVLYVVKV